MLFAAERRRISATAEGRSWPKSMQVLFTRLIASLDRAFDRPPGDFPRPLLLRTNVMLETELDATVARYGPSPRPIRDGCARVRGRIGRHLRSPESPAIESERAALPFRSPVQSPFVSSPYGERPDPIADEGSVRFHAGVDLAGSPGEIVVAAAPGRVSFAGWLEGSGNTVVVRHPAGYVSLYGHLYEILVERSAHVVAGAPLGLLGSTGRSTGPHLHFEIRRDGLTIDPMTVLR